MATRARPRPACRAQPPRARSVTSIRSASVAAYPAAPVSCPRGTCRTTMENESRIGKYALEEKLGEGGNGQVFAARDTVLGRRVALKLLHGQLITDATIAGRFRQEAQAMAQLSHPNVVVMHDFVSEGP